jgi:hypothetical protein
MRSFLAILMRSRDTFFSGFPEERSTNSQAIKKVCDFLEESGEALGKAVKLAESTEIDELLAAELHYCLAIQGTYVERWFSEDAYLVKLAGWRGGNRKRDRSKHIVHRAHAVSAISSMQKLYGFGPGKDVRMNTMKVISAVNGFMAGDVKAREFVEVVRRECTEMAVLDKSEASAVGTQLFSISNLACRWGVPGSFPSIPNVDLQALPSATEGVLRAPPPCMLSMVS